MTSLSTVARVSYITLYWRGISIEEAKIPTLKDHHKEIYHLQQFLLLSLTFRSFSAFPGLSSSGRVSFSYMGASWAVRFSGGVSVL